MVVLGADFLLESSTLEMKLQSNSFIKKTQYISGTNCTIAFFFVLFFFFEATAMKKEPANSQKTKTKERRRQRMGERKNDHVGEE